MKTGIVITLCNKEKSIDIVEIECFISVNEDIYICFVNNGSTDKTLTILELLSEKFPKNIGVVNIRNNKGNDAALKVGFRYLLNLKNVTMLYFSNSLSLNKLPLVTEFSSKLLIDG